MLDTDSVTPQIIRLMYHCSLRGDWDTEAVAFRGWRLARAGKFRSAQAIIHALGNPDERAQPWVDLARSCWPGQTPPAPAKLPRGKLRELILQIRNGQAHELLQQVARNPSFSLAEGKGERLAFELALAGEPGLAEDIWARAVGDSWFPLEDGLFRLVRVFCDRGDTARALKLGRKLYGKRFRLPVQLTALSPWPEHEAEQNIDVYRECIDILEHVVTRGRDCG